MYAMEDLRVELGSGYNYDKSRGKVRHIVAMPYPAQGHIVPLMQLCKQLASKEGYMVTFVNTEHNHARMVQAEAGQYHSEEINVEYEKMKGDNRNNYCNMKGSVPIIGNNNNIRLVGIPGGLPPELHGDPAHVVSAFLASEALAEPFGALLQKLAHDGEPATCIISDVLMSWTQSSADLFGIPRFAFWTSSAAVYHIIWHMYGLISQGIPTFKVANATFEDSNTEMVSCIPGLPPMDLNDLPIIVRSDPGDFIYQFLSRQLKPLERAAAVLLNTFFELEEHCLQALPSTSPVPIYPIGPLLPPTILHANFDDVHDDGKFAGIPHKELLDVKAADLIDRDYVYAADIKDPHASLHGESQNAARKSSSHKEIAGAVGDHDVQAACESIVADGNRAFIDKGSDVAGIMVPAAGKAREAAIEKDSGKEIDGGKTDGKASNDGKADGKSADGKMDWRSAMKEGAARKAGKEAGKDDAKAICADGKQGEKARWAAGKAGGEARGARGKAGKREGRREGGYGSAGIFSEDESCLEWLDKKEAGSVLYISFGSIFVMSEEQFTELVEGLQASKQAFLWSIRPGFVQGSSSYTHKLPPDFLDRTKSRGLMVSWVPQLTVLAHQAIGGFLTHCGWNSTLESVALGVPMLCWPDVGERRTNGRLAVSVWEAGLEFSCSFNAHMNALLISRHEVQRVVLLLMDPSSPAASHLRSKAAALQVSARLALSPTGSSSRAWNLFLHHIEYPP